jgi:site-specific DNA-methyltransferase (adenine-specific)/adenine-specific DNA-methyltransferase
MGSGTTIRVAKRLNRNFIGIDKNPESAKLLNMEPNTDYNNPINSIFIGDCLEVMTKLYEIHGSFIDLIYADPPFGRNSVDKHFGINWNDFPVDGDLLSILFGTGIIRNMKWEQQAYLTWLYPRIEMMRNLLKSTGSIYLHCDPS